MCMSEPKPRIESDVRDLTPSTNTAREEAKSPFIDFSARRRVLGIPKMTKELRNRLDRMIRGDE